MVQVMAVAFEPNGQLHYLDPGEARYRPGDWVLFPTSGGPEVCRVVWAPEHVDAEGFAGLPTCAGPATDADLARDAAQRARRAEILGLAKELITRHGLPMKVVGVDHLDRDAEYGQVAVVYFTAERRVDFRALVSDLAQALHARIDLRQVGARDATRLSGGVGSCGRELCCSTFLTDFEPVSMRLAKAQGLPPNPLQISGACGRLMCCLKYEQPMYTDFSRRAPAVGERVSTDAGDGVVIAHAVPDQAVVVRLEGGEVSRCPLESVCAKSTARKLRDGILRRSDADKR